MWLNNKIQYVVLAVVAAVFFGLLIFFAYPKAVLLSQIEKCNNTPGGEAIQIDCWQEVIRDIFDDGGTKEAFDVFEIIYKKYDVFARTGCHRHAHRVGDMSYYFDYLTHKDLTKVDFPDKAHLCGYGFYHGFFEHLVQDNPDTDYVTEMCSQMIAQLPKEIAPAIRQTCYHGSGHGFLLARVDELTEVSSWENRAFLEKPLQQCEALTKATTQDRDECRQGVYNVFTDWMAGGEFGFSLNYEEPFDICMAERLDRQADCIYEVAQKFDQITNGNPLEMARLSEFMEDPNVRNTAISTGVAGIVQNNPMGKQEVVLAQCLELPESIIQACIAGIVGGLIEHDISGSNYVRAAFFCEEGKMDAERREDCFLRAVRQMGRFRTLDQLKTSCTQGVYPKRFCDMVEYRISKAKTEVVY